MIITALPISLIYDIITERRMSMSVLYYDIPLEEEYIGPNGEYKYAKTNIPHFDQIAEWLPKEWHKCKIHKTFDGILKDKVESCEMKCIKRRNGHAIARITVNFIPNFRLSQQKRQSCWEQLDAQMSDGFGKSYDHMQIPNAEKGWTLYL